jgi:ribosomal-protein-alanine N-acetyltransferase
VVFLRSVPSVETGPVLYGDTVTLRVPQASDFREWAELRQKSRDFLVPWEPTWPQDDLTKSAFRRRIRRYQQDIRDDRAYPFFAFRSDDDVLVGGLTLSNVRRGVAQACSLGYWVGAPYARQGHMSAAVATVIPFVFGQLGFHRLEAACLPSNDASIRLLKKSRFTEEGYARRYLKINGVWQDHLLFALLSGDAPS